jgi:regulator of cell morphogenesis and NO signaling
MNQFNGHEKVGTIVAEFPGAAEIFKKHKIDFCCGGDRKLHDVITAQGLDFETILQELNAHYVQKKMDSEKKNIDWREESITNLVDHIVQTHHAFLQRELPQISELVAKIVRVHGGGHSELLNVHLLFQQLRTEIEQHLAKEEELLFPIVKRYDQENNKSALKEVVQVIDEIENEHEGAGGILKELRKITSDYKIPLDACATYHLAFKRLEALENDLFRHIHLENNVLHPKLKQAVGK